MDHYYGPTVGQANDALVFVFDIWASPAIREDDEPVDAADRALAGAFAVWRKAKNLGTGRALDG